MVQTGLPRMAARVFASLVTTDAGAMTAAELVQRLRVSPASISKAVGYLERLDLLQRHRDRRRARYLIDDDVWLQTWMSSARTNASWAEAADQGARIVGTDTPAGARLRRMSRFFAQLSEDMSGGPSEAAGNDVRTVTAALVHAARPLTADRLAAALDWPADRVAGALHDAVRFTETTDPVTVAPTADDAYTVAAAPHRLTPAQRAALHLR